MYVSLRLNKKSRKWHLDLHKDSGRLLLRGLPFRAGEKQALRRAELIKCHPATKIVFHRGK